MFTRGPWLLATVMAVLLTVMAGSTTVAQAQASEVRVEAPPDPTVDVTLPSSTSEPLVLASGEDTVTVGVPGEGARAEPLAPSSEADGVKINAQSVGSAAAYSNVATATSLEIAASAYGAQQTLHIRGSEAPTEYTFPVSVNGEGAQLELMETGIVAIADAQGDVVAVVDVPWARDASQSDVPTAFRVEGSTLVQTVDHTGAMYPVAADPRVYFGPDYIDAYFSPYEQEVIVEGGIVAATAAAGTLCAVTSGPAIAICAAGAAVLGFIILEAVRANFNPTCDLILRWAFGADGQSYTYRYANCV